MTTRTPATEKPVQLDVSILGRDYKVACRESERAELMQAVALLDGRMREIRDTGKIAAVDRIAVMAALNMANELLRSRNVGESLEGNAKLRLQAMRERIEGTLQAGRQLDL